MNFYFSLFQIIETVDRLSREVQHLAGRALRISPRDARANRELLEQCQDKLTDIQKLLNNKAHISKITLRKASLLYQILEVVHRRVVHLAAATGNLGHDDEQSVKAVWQLLASAQKHYQTMVKTIHEATGVAATVALAPEEPFASHDIQDILKREMQDQQELLKLLEKSIEVFGEEQELSDTLVVIRKELLETKKRMKHLAPAAQVIAPPAAHSLPQAPKAPVHSHNAVPA